MIIVNYKEEERNFDAQLVAFKYSYRIQVIIKEVKFNFERDDAGNFRTLAANPDDKSIQKVEAGLVRAIAEKIEALLF